MLAEKKITDAVLSRYRLGTGLIWLGVFTWAPFIVLRIVGEKPSLFWFLPFHLLGVIGGSRLRSMARNEMGTAIPKRNLLRVIGHGVIYAGVLVWAPYFYLKLIAQQPVNVMNFLPYHLAGISSGMTLLVISYLISRKDDVKV